MADRAKPADAWAVIGPDDKFDAYAIAPSRREAIKVFGSHPDYFGSWEAKGYRVARVTITEKTDG